MSLPSRIKYPEYKNSGHIWLGEVPTSWEVRRIGYFFEERREKVSDKDFPPLSVTKKGIVPQLESAAKSDDGDNRKLVRSGDFVINSRSDRKGSSGISSLDGSVSLINTVITPKSEINGNYAHHLFRSLPFQEEYYRFGKGIVADLWTTNFSEMKNIVFALPPLDEQRAIAKFLDAELAKIDALIGKQETLIKLIKEKRKSVVSKALTKGLNPNSDFVDSKISWIGQYPSHWQLGRLKNVISINPSHTENINISSDMPTPFFPMEKISDDGILDCEYERPFSEVAAGYTYFKNGDVIVAKVTPCFENGKGALVQGLGAGFGFGTTELVVMRPGKEIDGKYLYFISISQEIREGGVAYMTGAGGLKRVPDNFFLNSYWPIPPLAEQIAINKYLEDRLSVFDKLVEKSKQSIALLGEHRTSLIAEAVTGKIDVRNFS